MKTAFLLIFSSAVMLHAQLSPLAPNAPKDKPVSAEGEKWAAFERAIAPFVEKARATYPDAKKRYLEGLPPGHVFFLVTRLHDAGGLVEQVFVEVKSIKGDKVTGVIASDINTVKSFARGQPYTFPEEEIYDWLISKPDGTEEGNIVGKFIDAYKP